MKCVSPEPPLSQTLAAVVQILVMALVSIENKRDKVKHIAGKRKMGRRRYSGWNKEVVVNTFSTVLYLEFGYYCGTINNITLI